MDFNADWIIICSLKLASIVAKNHKNAEYAKVRPRLWTKAVFEHVSCHISYTWCRHSRCNRLLPSLISITPQAQLRLSVLEAVVSKHMALTRLSTSTLEQL